MSDQLPPMIPMPDEAPPGPGPGEITRQLSPQEEQDVLVNFMGNMYGEAKKMDNHIIGPSTTLQKGKSEEIKKHIEQVIAQPQQSVPQQVQAAPPQLEVQQPQVQVQQPIAQVEQQLVDDSQLSFNFNTTEKDELFLLIEKISTRLDRLHYKVDDLAEIVKNSKVSSLPIKKQTKKKSVDKKEEI
jgi:hypothetical protein